MSPVICILIKSSLDTNYRFESEFFLFRSYKSFWFYFIKLRLQSLDVIQFVVTVRSYSDVSVVSYSISVALNLNDTAFHIEQYLRQKGMLR